MSTQCDPTSQDYITAVVSLAGRSQSPGVVFSPDVVFAVHILGGDAPPFFAAPLSRTLTSVAIELRWASWPATSGIDRSSLGSFDGSRLSVYITIRADQPRGWFLSL